MDPNQTFLDMFAAMKSGDFATARELALGLKEWFAKGGFYPHQYTPEAMHAYTASVLRCFGASVLRCFAAQPGMAIRSPSPLPAAIATPAWTSLRKKKR
jgi:hypothetical protein